MKINYCIIHDRLYIYIYFSYSSHACSKMTPDTFDLQLFSCSTAADKTSPQTQSSPNLQILCWSWGGCNLSHLTKTSHVYAYKQFWFTSSFDLRVFSIVLSNTTCNLHTKFFQCLYKMKREQFALGIALFCSLLHGEALFLKPYNSLCCCRASGEEGRLALHDTFVVESLLLWLSIITLVRFRLGILLWK